MRRIESYCISGRNHKTWFDQITIGRWKSVIKEKWLFILRGDPVNFGVGSDLTWQLQGYVDYQFSKLFQLFAGYRFLSSDYHTCEAPKNFVFNVDEFGPVTRFGFNF
jgi:hypothetical protein